MDWREVELDNCPLVGALEVIGRPWTIPVLRDVMHGVTRFDALQAHLGVSRPVLSRRLRELVDDGLLERRPYRLPGDRERSEYVPTAKAWDLLPVLVGLTDWGTRHLDLPGGPSVTIADKRTGEPVKAAVVPAATPSLGPHEIRVRPGPGG